MKSTRHLFYAVCAASCASAAFIAACASDESTTAHEDGDASIITPAPDASIDADAADDDAAGPCTDCEYFPADCTSDALCANGPFQPTTTPAPLDWRAQITSIRGRSATDVWAVGSLGTIAHFDGTAWSTSDSGRLDTLSAMWLRDGAEAAFGTASAIVTRGLPEQDGGLISDGGWSTRSATTSAKYGGQVMLVSSAWAAAGSENLYFTVVSSISDRKAGLWRLALSPAGDFQVMDVFDQGVSPGAVNKLCESLPCSQLTSLYGIGPNEMWAVSLSGAAIHVANADTAKPTVDVYNTQTWDALYGVWATSSSEAWAVGARGSIRHYAGTGRMWDIVGGVPTEQNLNAIWGSSPTDIWAVGDAGVVLHYDGKAWSRIKIAGLGKKRPNLTTVWMPSAGHVWIGGQGVVLSLGGTP
ncbi:hypothetical protein AKJ09_11437 [Labilithrix luteola]|uniref:Type IV fimbrial biogenesis protein PilY1 n=1 Tax=Labilithrix luteola TaxID=1391654 RepID=A0A0K1QG87_9BACT|nr:hypothetical protein [Labilithrix luteola]AKV04774.1 hypothetical protein AKJ09_11437 [Labilithrix luteola]